jgi:hypothetical protein
METTSINLVPLADMLTTGVFTPDEIVNLLDELAYDYAQTVLALQIADLTPKNCVHEKADTFIYLLKELRDVIRECNITA